MTAVTEQPQGLTLPPEPHVPARAGVARLLFRRTLTQLEGVEVIAPDGHPLRAEPGAPRMTITSDAFFHRLGRDGKIGFGEAYMAGDWHADDLPGVLTAFGRRLTRLIHPRLQRLRRLYEPARPRHEQNTTEGAARNVSRHYDLSNELFALFLDETMAYSCAVFGPGDDLAAAQRRKYDAICDLARISPGDHVLEIGTGWAGFAIHAAAMRGCRVTTATISRRQLELARARVAEAGLDDRVEVILRDYRQIAGTYECVVSIEMLEAVGEEYWPGFFAACDRLLAPGGTAAVQTITMPHERYLASRRSSTWIQKYIFPGGLIPSAEAIDRALHSATTLRVTHATEIGHHYATTAAAWRERFLANAGRVLELGFDETFVRMWDFYLAYCQAGFATGAIGDVQLRLERPA
jgi:cyclopropane-fatty-acyl-phospholipid synthase